MPQPKKKDDDVQWDDHPQNQAVSADGVKWDDEGQGPQSLQTTPDLSSQNSPTGKFAHAVGENVNPFPAIVNAIQNPEQAVAQVNPINRLIHGDMNALPEVVGGPVAGNIYDMGKQLYGDVSKGGYAEAAGHLVGDILPLLTGERINRVNPEAVGEFTKGAVRQAVKTPVPWRGSLMGHYMGMPAPVGAGIELGSRIPNIIRAGIERKGETPWLRPTFSEIQESKNSPYAKETGYRFNPDDYTETPKSVGSVVEKPKDVKWPGGTSGEPIPIKEKEPKVYFNPEDYPVKPWQSKKDVSPKMAQPKVVEIKHPSTETPADKPIESKAKEELPSQNPKTTTNLTVEDLSENEKQGILNRRENSSKFADRHVPYIAKVDPNEVIRWGDENDEAAYKSYQLKANEDHLMGGGKIDTIPSKNVRPLSGQGYKELRARALKQIGDKKLDVKQPVEDSEKKTLTRDIGRGKEELRTVSLDKIVKPPPPEWRPQGNTIYPERVEEYKSGTKKSEPIILDKEENGTHTIHDGHHRFDAAKARGDKDIKAWVQVE